MAIFSLTNIAVSLVSLFIAHRIYWESTTGSRRRALAKRHGCAPPKKRPGHPLLLGLDFIWDNFQAHKKGHFLEQWVHALKAQDAHTISMSVLGQQLCLTDDPDNIKALLATNFDEWSIGRERIDAMASYLGHGIFTNEGAAWKRSREMLRPCFERSQVADVSIFDEHTSRLVEILEGDGWESGATIDLQPLFHELSLDVATEFLFGRSTESLCRTRENNKVKGFVEALEYCTNPFGRDMAKRWGLLGLFLPDGKEKRCAQTIREFADTIIEEEIAASKTSNEKKENRYIFLDELLAATQDRTTIRSELLNILLAGRDTTASLLSNVLWELARHSNILTRLRSEIEEVVGNDTPTYQQIKDLKYLRAIINESQRLYPIVPVNSREALTDTVLPRGGGPDGIAPILIPKGSYFAYHTYSMHRRTDIYGDDALEFNPDRWLEPKFRPGWAYIPFSGGPRICIGQNFALTEAMFVVVRLVQEFDIERRDFEEWREKLGLTCMGAGGCKVGLRRRS